MINPVFAMTDKLKSARIFTTPVVLCIIKLHRDIIYDYDFACGFQVMQADSYLVGLNLFFSYFCSMKNLNFYIAYLLTKHECVIIPGFGAFVVFSVFAIKKEIEGVLCPPAQSLGFNPEITHNDGLLTHFVSERESIPYKDADRFIKQYANQLNEQLNTAKTVMIKWIGNLSISSDNKIIFTPDIHLSCNTVHFGFNNFYLPQLKELEPEREIQEKEEKNPVIVTISFNRRILVKTVSIAASIFALSLTPVSLNNNSVQYVSNASFFPVYRIAVNEVELREKPVPEILSFASSDTGISMAQQPDKPVNMHHYYIIIASFPAKDLAEIALADFKQTGLPEVRVISNEKRHRIYIKSFEKKEEAESYLVTFRKDNPKYADAWLLSQ
jgi:nucleoid DNA-binding protein